MGAKWCSVVGGLACSLVPRREIRAIKVRQVPKSPLRPLVSLDVPGDGLPASSRLADAHVAAGLFGIEKPAAARGRAAGDTFFIRPFLPQKTWRFGKVFSKKRGIWRAILPPESFDGIRP